MVTGLTSEELKRLREIADNIEKIAIAGQRQIDERVIKTKNDMIIAKAEVTKKPENYNRIIITLKDEVKEFFIVLHKDKDNNNIYILNECTKKIGSADIIDKIIYENLESAQKGMCKKFAQYYTEKWHVFDLY